MDNTKFWINLRLKFKYLREGDCLTQTEMANRLGVSKSYISKIESGQKKPSIDFLLRCSKVIYRDVSVYFLHNKNLGF